MHVVLEAPASALDLCKDGSKVVVAGRSVFKIFSVEEEFVERDNLRVGKNINLNFSWRQLFLGEQLKKTTIIKPMTKCV